MPRQNRADYESAAQKKKRQAWRTLGPKPKRPKKAPGTPGPAPEPDSPRYRGSATSGLPSQSQEMVRGLRDLSPEEFEKLSVLCARCLVHGGLEPLAVLEEIRKLQAGLSSLEVLIDYLRQDLGYVREDVKKLKAGQPELPLASKLAALEPAT